MSPRTQTLVQLTDELVELLDQRSEATGVSRSALIRAILTEALDADRAEADSQRMIDGYRRVPQETAQDAWGDLDLWTQTNSRRNLAALGDEEDSPW